MVREDFDWLDHSLKLLQACNTLVVYTQEGWTKSSGVALEIQEAKRLGIPIYFAEPGADHSELISELLEQPLA